MNLKKQLVTAVATLALGASLIGGGTFAYFSDEAVSKDNTFQTGVLNLKSGQSETLSTLSFDTKKPGDKQVYTYALNNAGDFDISKVLLALSYTATDPDGNGTDLGTQLKLNYLKLGSTIVDLHDVDANNDTKVTLKELKDYSANNTIQLAGISKSEAAKDLAFELEFIETNSDQNDYQGEGVTFDINLDARQ